MVSQESRSNQDGIFWPSRFISRPQESSSKRPKASRLLFFLASYSDTIIWTTSATQPKCFEDSTLSLVNLVAIPFSITRIALSGSSQHICYAKISWGTLYYTCFPILSSFQGYLLNAMRPTRIPPTLTKPPRNKSGYGVSHPDLDYLRIRK